MAKKRQVNYDAMLTLRTTKKAIKNLDQEASKKEMTTSELIRQKLERPLP